MPLTDNHGADDHGADDHGDAPPPAIGQAERRMQVRAYNFWAGLLGKGPFPPVERLLKGFHPDFADHSVLLRFDESAHNPVVAFLGSALARECGAEGAIAQLADVPGRSVLSRITEHYLQIVANQAPIGFEAEFVNQREQTILYRGILLPFSSDGTTIDHVYGVINWKEVADRATTDELLLEISQALETPVQRPPLELLAEWADGPELLLGPTEEALTEIYDSLRRLPATPLATLPRSGAEYSLVMVRRRGGGAIDWLGEIDSDPALFEQALRHLNR